MFTLSEGLHLITIIELTQDMAENCHIYILFRLKAISAYEKYIIKVTLNLEVILIVQIFSWYSIPQ